MKINLKKIIFRLIDLAKREVDKEYDDDTKNINILFQLYFILIVRKF